MESIDSKDIGILRDLAKRCYEYSQTEKMQNLKKQWKRHGSFEEGRPMLHIELDTFVDEIIPPLLKCHGETARKIETSLYRCFVNHELFDDDYVVKDYYPVSVYAGLKLFGLDVERTHTAGVGYQFVHPVNDLEDDFHLLEGETSYSHNEQSVKEHMDVVNSIFGDILPAKIEGASLAACPTYHVVTLMGMENMMFSMVDYPELFKRMMDMIADAFLGLYEFCKEHNLLMPTVSGEHLCQGTWCYTDQLPGLDEYNKRQFTSKDVWGYMDSQETVGISPDSFEEFIRPCYEKIARNLGRLSYGCCEPVHPIFDSFLSTLPNLGRVSISPWCNEEFMGERLRGKKIIYHRKPSPNFLGVGNSLDESAIIEHIDKTLAAAKGCALEISQRDVYTVSKSPEKVRRYVEIIKSRF